MDLLNDFQTISQRIIDHMHEILHDKECSRYKPGTPNVVRLTSLTFTTEGFALKIELVFKRSRYYTCTELTEKVLPPFKSKFAELFPDVGDIIHLGFNSREKMISHWFLRCPPLTIEKGTS